MSNTTENRRWELVLKEINGDITSDEKEELILLQKEVFQKTKLLDRNKPSVLSLDEDF